MHTLIITIYLTLIMSHKLPLIDLASVRVEVISSQLEDGGMHYVL